MTSRATERQSWETVYGDALRKYKKDQLHHACSLCRDGHEHSHYKVGPYTPGDLPDSRPENRQRAEAIMARHAKTMEVKTPSIVFDPTPAERVPNSPERIAYLRMMADWYNSPAGREKAAQDERKRSRSEYRSYKDKIRAESRTCINCDCLDSDHSTAIDPDLRPCLACSDCIIFQQAPTPKPKMDALAVMIRYVMPTILFVINAALAFAIGGWDRTIVMSVVWLTLLFGTGIIAKKFLDTEPRLR